MSGSIKGHALKQSAKSGLLYDPGKVAVLMCEAFCHNWSSVDLVQSTHHWEYSALKILYIHLNTLRMPAPQTPVTSPVTLFFNGGEVQLTSVIELEIKQHSVTCDLCSQVITLGVKGSIIHISQHRDSERCERTAFNMSKLASKSQNLVDGAIQIILCSCSDWLMSGWWWIIRWSENGQHFIHIPSNSEHC